jgi:hypothetical protein
MEDEKNVSPLLASSEDAYHDSAVFHQTLQGLQDEKRHMTKHRFDAHPLLLFFAYSLAACLYVGLFLERTKSLNKGKSASSYGKDIFPSMITHGGSPIQMSRLMQRLV